jgi:hypothetical protein
MNIDVLTHAITSFLSQPEPHNMEDDEMSILDSPLESGEMSPRQSAAIDKQRANLQTYLDALPYQCESVEEMQVQLEYIVGKIAVCVKSRNWLVLTTWDGLLQWYVPISSSELYESSCCKHVVGY